MLENIKQRQRNKDLFNKAEKTDSRYDDSEDSIESSLTNSVCEYISDINSNPILANHENLSNLQRRCIVV